MTWLWLALPAGLALWVWTRRARTARDERRLGAVILRQVDDLKQGIRRLTAFRTPDGGIRIEGLDYGDEVERILGEREYEWIMTLEPAAVLQLLTVLGTEDDPLTALERRFGDDRSSDLNAFLDEHGIPYDFWSRTGD